MAARKAKRVEVEVVRMLRLGREGELTTQTLDEVKEVSDAPSVSDG